MLVLDIHHSVSVFLYISWDIPGGGHCNLAPLFLPIESQGQRSLEDSVNRVAKSQTCACICTFQTVHMQTFQDDYHDKSNYDMSL